MSGHGNDRRLMIRLFGYTTSDDPKLRAAAYRALGNFEYEDSVVSCLISGMSDHDSEVRRAAGSSLINMGFLTSVK